MLKWFQYRFPEMTGSFNWSPRYLPECIKLTKLVSYRDIDKVDELMQDIAEQQELADEISTAISKPVGIGEEFDDVRINN